mmetsp:Transcript_48324/g.103617  ORF Transcript_48324/g.103617 Transcript_48324/m.103617 type:complete len:258 (+) Transcript_48324:111-884(+)
MPPPPEKEDSQGQDFLKAKGHWTWARDEGFSAVANAYVPFTQPLTDTIRHFIKSVVPDLTFSKISDFRWEIRRGDTSLFGEKPLTEFVEIGRESPLRTIRDIFSGNSFQGHVKAYWENAKLCVHTYAVGGESAKVDYIVSYEVVNEELYQHAQDLITEASGSRVYKIYPYYEVDNQTRKPVQLWLYNNTDRVQWMEKAIVDILPGKQFVEASGPEVEEEHGHFRVAIRDPEKGKDELIYDAELSVQDMYVLTTDMFD